MKQMNKPIPLLVDQNLSFPLLADHFILFEENSQEKIPLLADSLVSELPCWRTGLYLPVYKQKRRTQQTELI